MYYCIWAETFPEQGWEEFFVKTENVMYYENVLYSVNSVVFVWGALKHEMIQIKVQFSLNV